MKKLWDKEEDCEAINYDGTLPAIIDDNTVLIKGLGCNCNPATGSMCGGCIDIWDEHHIGSDGQYYWKAEIIKEWPERGVAK